jgi:uncharacterized membrane protein YdbT with pleckstrin-like domain
VRGSEPLELENAGSHSLYVYRGASQRLDADANRAWDAAPTAKVVVVSEKTGETVAVREAYETTDLMNTRFARLVEFDIPSAGNYAVTITPSLKPLSPSVSPTVPVDEIERDLMGWMTRTFIALGIGALGMIISVTIFGVVLVRRRRFAKQLAEDPGQL